jgi:hypothetical protein
VRRPRNPHGDRLAVIRCAHHGMGMHNTGLSCGDYDIDVSTSFTRPSTTATAASARPAATPSRTFRPVQKAALNSATTVVPMASPISHVSNWD